MLINSIRHTKSESDLLFYIPEVFKTTFKTGFWVQNHVLYLCFSAVDSQYKGYCVKKSKSWCEMFVSKLSGIQLTMKNYNTPSFVLQFYSPFSFSLLREKRKENQKVSKDFIKITKIKKSLRTNFRWKSLNNFFVPIQC